MDEVSDTVGAPATANVVNFDEAMLDACSPQARDDLLAEAALLMRAFAPDGDPEHLAAMARALASGERDDEKDRNHISRLAAALRHLGRQGAR